MAFHAISDTELGGDETLEKGPGDFSSLSVIQPSNNDKFMAAFEDESDSSGRDGQSISGWSSDGSAHSPHSESSPRPSRSSMKIRRRARSKPSAELRRRASSSNLRSHFGDCFIETSAAIWDYKLTSPKHTHHPSNQDDQKERSKCTQAHIVS